ncbi:hypothetical protein KCU77_g2637, partial [Aureobasidium melanogenum]
LHLHYYYQDLQALITANVLRTLQALSQQAFTRDLAHLRHNQTLRTSYAADRADLLRRLQVQRDEADERLSAPSAQHSSALATKDQEIRELRSDLAFADLREEGARFKASGEVIKLRKEIGHLQCKLGSLEGDLDAQEELVAGAEKAQEKVKVAEERALVAAQKALEANQKVEAAKKAQEKVKVAGERALAAARKNAQTAIDEVRGKAERAYNALRVEEFKVQDRDQELKALKKEMEKLKAGVAVRAAASDPMPPILQSVSTASQADELRARIETADSPVSGPRPMFGPAPAVIVPPVDAPWPSAPAGQSGVRTSRRGGRQPTGPFAPIRWGANSKRGA